METDDQFLWGGLRTRLERTGKVRPRTIRLEAVGQTRDPVLPQVFFKPRQSALRRHMQTAAHAERAG